MQPKQKEQAKEEFNTASLGREDGTIENDRLVSLFFSFRFFFHFNNEIINVVMILLLQIL
jgi:hypothetical protein